MKSAHVQKHNQIDFLVYAVFYLHFDLIHRDFCMSYEASVATVIKSAQNDFSATHTSDTVYIFAGVQPLGDWLRMPTGIVTICLRGKIFVIPRSCILRKPGTRLCEALEEAQDDDIPLYFNRNSEFFELILDYYATGELHVSRNVCFESFKNELQFWKINLSELSPCCQTKVVADEQGQYLKTVLKVRNILRSEHDHLLEMKARGTKLSCWEQIRLFLEEPSSSLAARVSAYALWTLYFYCLGLHR
jgi:hypothetical protein